MSLSNLSTREYDGIGDSVLITEFLLSSQKTVTIRAPEATIGGPPFNVFSVVANPKLIIYDGASAAIVTNDAYPRVAEVTALGKANNKA